MTPARLRQIRASLAEERQSAALYAALAAQESDHRMAFMLQRLGDAATQQAMVWQRMLTDAGAADDVEARLDARARLALWLARQFGVRPVRGILSALKIRGMSAYNAPHLRGHVRIDERSQIQAAPASNGNLRAAVFGANDGLVSNTSLILGMAGAAADSNTVLLAGVAGLLAGALSMAAGEYVSVRSQREVFEHQIALERAELAEYPDAERRELAVIYEAKGLPPEDADRIARTLIDDPELALDTMAREELGLNPDELGSPWGAAASSFLAFSVGAAVPVAPHLVLSGQSALLASAGLSAVALFSVGATLSLFTGRAALWSGLRMLAIGSGAGLLTFSIGRLLGIAL